MKSYWCPVCRDFPLNGASERDLCESVCGAHDQAVNAEEIPAYLMEGVSWAMKARAYKASDLAGKASDALKQRGM